MGDLLFGDRQRRLLYTPVGAAAGAPRRAAPSDAARRGVGGNSRRAAGSVGGLTGAKHQPPTLPDREGVSTGEGR